MEHLIEDNNISITKDSLLPSGDFVKAGTGITTLSLQGEFNGFKMRVPPPEFEALMFFNALEAATNAELLKKSIKVGKSDFDRMAEIEISSSNRAIFFKMCQLAMAAVTFSISSIESWVNKSFVLHGEVNGKPVQLRLARPTKPDKLVLSDEIASDLRIPIRSKIFQLAPQIFEVPPLKDHSTLKKEVGGLIDERNIVMHMQAKLSIDRVELGRVSYAVKLFKASTFHGPEQILNYLNYIYERSSIAAPAWLAVANKELKAQRKKLK